MKNNYFTPAMGRVNLEVGGVKSRIFMLTYKGQFWSCDDVLNVFPVRFELKKRLRIISEHSEHKKQFVWRF